MNRKFSLFLPPNCDVQVAYGLWFIAEVAIASTDLAEVIGSAVAFNLLFGLPIWAGVLITAADVLFIIIFGIKHFRLLEILVMSLCMVITGCFAYEFGAAKPDWADVASGFIPKGRIVTNSENMLPLVFWVPLSCPTTSSYILASYR